MPDYDHIQNGVTWLGGTTHELQRQHIPGYAGHIHGLSSENVYGKNYARVTAECLNQRNPRGIDPSIVTDQPLRTTSTAPVTRTNSISLINARTSSSPQPSPSWVDSRSRSMLSTRVCRNSITSSPKASGKCLRSTGCPSPATWVIGLSSEHPSSKVLFTSVSPNTN